MKYIQLLLLALSITFISFAQTPTAQKLDPAMAIKKSKANNVTWLDVREDPFNLVGFEWIKQDNVFRRLPLNPDWKIREEVNHLANQTAGGQLRFKTNSNKIFLKVELAERSGMYHMPATGQSGFDLYVKENEIQRYLETTRFPHDTIQYQQEFKVGETNKMQEFIFNFPLYNGVKSVSIGVEKNSLIEKPSSFTQSGKIVIYGTSITQGGCVSRPGMVYSNILSRKLDTEFVNLGFSGNGRGEPELANIINQISGMKLIILDYEANANKTIQKTIYPFVDILRKKYPKIPILIMSKTRYARAIDGSDAYKTLISNRDFQKKLVVERKNNGDSNIYFLDGSTVLGEDYYECTVDGSHPSDLGSYRIAQALLKKIKEIVFDN
ncbi:MAG: SGNH/GDSL hydrolase family protein [Flavobacteriaceae bacterium]|nr:SGNH/GDSL hydrolase family protein [Flavobacteriaceae bacterium]